MGNSGDENTVQGAVYTALRENIMTLKMKPGTVMSTQEIATKLNVSRTPVREAFIRLQRDGLVNIFPQKETVVSKIDIQRIQQERFIRESLECVNIDRLIEVITKKDFADLLFNLEQESDVIKANDSDAFVLLDNEFHKQLFKITNQLLSWETIQNVSIQYARIRFVTVWDDGVMEASLNHHRNILEAIKNRDGDLAKVYLKSHLHRLENEIKNMVKAHPDFFVEDTIPKADKFSQLLVD